MFVRSYRSIKCNNGFTILEILVATVILFSVIAVVSLVYRGALLSSNKATEHVFINGKVPLIIDQVKSEIQLSMSDINVSELSGEGRLWLVGYQWSATQKSYDAPQPEYSPDSGKMEYFQPKYKLWSVFLEVNYKSISKKFTYQEISWQYGS